MKILYNLALRIQTGRATRVLKPNRIMLNKVQKEDPEKNGFEVSQKSILYVFCYKMCTILESRRQ